MTLFLTKLATVVPDCCWCEYCQNCPRNWIKKCHICPLGRLVITEMFIFNANFGPLSDHCLHFRHGYTNRPSQKAELRDPSLIDDGLCQRSLRCLEKVPNTVKQTKRKCECEVK
ncbi:hypothetical protein ACTXT7_012478 [Hymenolepis weldensis]